MATKKEETTKTETKTELSPELEAISGARSPLALVPAPGSTGYQVFQPVEMTAERKTFLKKQFTPLGCSDLELEYFIAFCERTGMDPVLKQAYLVERSANVNGTWVKKFEPMVSEQGMAAKADSLPDFRGMRDGLVHENDTFKINRVTGEVVHESGHPSKRGRLVGAWASVLREGRVVPPSYFSFEEKAQYTKDGKLTKFWNQGGPSQLLKCARAEQWRQGWPGIFNGQFIAEEMREEVDVTAQSEATVGGERRATTDVLADRMKAAAAKTEDTQPSAKTATVEVVASKPVESKPEEPKQDTPKSEAPKTIVGYAELKQDLARYEILYDVGRLETDKDYAAEKAGEVAAHKAKPVEKKTESAPAAEIPVMVFGEFKKKPIADLTGPQLLEQIGFGESKLKDLKDENLIARVRWCINAIKFELKKREEAMLDDKPMREPGEDDGL